MTFEESFKAWLEDKVRREKAQVFIHYSNIQARWDSLWWTEDMERAHKQYWENRGVKIASARVKGKQ